MLKARATGGATGRGRPKESLPDRSTVRPSLSIVTATYEAAATISALIESLEHQDLSDFEWIVRDGGSTDATTSLVEAAKLPSVRLVSQPDAGIYDAFNHALDEVRGDYVLFLGADDRIASPSALGDAIRAIRALADPPDALLCSVVDDAGARFVSRVGAMTLVLNTVHHQGVLYRRAMFDDFRYRVDSRIVADYELNLLLRLRNRRTASADLVLAECGSAGVSRTSNEWQLYRDLHDLRSGHVPRMLSFALLVVGTVNIIRRRILGRHL